MLPSSLCFLWPFSSSPTVSSRFWLSHLVPYFMQGGISQPIPVPSQPPSPFLSSDSPGLDSYLVWAWGDLFEAWSSLLVPRL